MQNENRLWGQVWEREDSSRSRESHCMVTAFIKALKKRKHSRNYEKIRMGEARTRPEGRSTVDQVIGWEVGWALAKVLSLYLYLGHRKP